jgi:predicted transcriptional regulator
MSIKPKYAEKIFTGEKRVEYRRKMWIRDDVDTVIVYASAPISKIVGEFTPEPTIGTGTLGGMWLMTKELSGVSKEEFDKYFHGTYWGHAIHIAEFVKYEKPLPLSLFSIKRPPQNFMYLPEETNA